MHAWYSPIHAWYSHTCLVLTMHAWYSPMVGPMYSCQHLCERVRSPDTWVVGAAPGMTRPQYGRLFYGCSTVVLIGFTCPAITVVTVMLRALRTLHRHVAHGSDVCAVLVWQMLPRKCRRPACRYAVPSRLTHRQHPHVASPTVPTPRHRQLPPPPPPPPIAHALTSRDRFASVTCRGQLARTQPVQPGCTASGCPPRCRPVR